MVRVAVLTSNEPRHLYFLQKMSEHFEVCRSFGQPKKGYYEDHRSTSPAMAAHFKSLQDAEKMEFEGLLTGAATGITIVDDINDERALADARQAGVELVFLFGTSILGKPWLDAFPNRIINLHLGLSPFYRGAATLFWPLANGELECVGATIHLAVEKVDAGGILRRVKADPKVGDSYYSLTNRLIRRAIDVFPATAAAFAAGNLGVIPQHDRERVRAYRKSDFDEAALQRTLAFFGNGLTAAQIQAASERERCVCSQ